MKTVTAYESSDGKIFKNRQECLNHEADVNLLSAIQDFLIVRELDGARIYADTDDGEEIHDLEKFLVEHIGQIAAIYKAAKGE